MAARRVDLRVDDDPEPLAELDRLLDLHDAYELATVGRRPHGAGPPRRGGRRLRRARARSLPGNHELLFWAGLAAAQAGDMPLALERVRGAIALRPAWRDLLGRLEPDIAPSAAAVREALDDELNAAERGRARSGRWLHTQPSAAT